WPAFSNGVVDHFVNTFGDFRLRRKGRWAVNHPEGYMPASSLGNQLLIMNAGPSLEAGGLIASASRVGVYAYAAGTNGGVSPLITNGGFGNVLTYLHENTRSVFYLFDSDTDVAVVFDRVRAEDPRLQTIT